MSDGGKTKNLRNLTAKIEFENVEELQQLIEKASNLTIQLKETLQQIESIVLKT